MSLSELFVRSVDLKEGCDAPHFLKAIFPFCFRKNISVIIGDNGSGKSTFLEAMAIKLGCNPEGGGRNFHFKTEDSHSSLHQSLRVIKGYRKERDIFFYRAESFYNVTTEIRKLDAAESFDPKLKTYYGGKDLHEVSHGEAMEALYQCRFKENGLYILDEPESSLSAQRQLSFISRICDLAERGSQFVIATHSPIVMFTPGCDLFQIDSGRLHQVNARDTEMFSVYHAVLSSSGAFLKKLNK